MYYFLRKCGTVVRCCNTPQKVCTCGCVKHIQTLVYMFYITCRISLYVYIHIRSKKYMFINKKGEAAT